MPAPQQQLIITPSIDIAHEIQDEANSVHSSSSGGDKEMQHDLSGGENSDSVIDAVITRDRIATEDDLKQDQVHASNAIHTATKRCEQFSDERWENFQTFFMLPKEGNDGTDPKFNRHRHGLSFTPASR
jgi:hypothetical protein